MAEIDYEKQRQEMVIQQLESRDISDSRVLAAMRQVPRHLFVPDHVREAAYADGPLPIGHGQTISQPYIVALMTQLGRTGEARRALDVGTGCGYQAAVLATIVPEVFSVEVVPELAASAARRLSQLGVANVQVRCGDGSRGWPEAAPFDLIVVACAPPEPPPPLIEQLAPLGRLIVPVGELPAQELLHIQKQEDGSLCTSHECSVLFVPMLGPTSRPV